MKKEYFIYVPLAIAIVVIICDLFSVKKYGKPSVFGYQLEYVATDSMYPTIRPRSFVIASVNTDDLKPGDICTYIHPKDEKNDSCFLVTHRLVKDLGNDVYVFKGDNKNKSDKLPVAKKNVRYKVIYIF